MKGVWVGLTVSAAVTLLASAVGVYHLVPGAAGVQERAREAAVECRVAGCGGGQSRSGAGQREHELIVHARRHSNEHPVLGRPRSAPDRACRYGLKRRDSVHGVTRKTQGRSPTAVAFLSLRDNDCGVARPHRFL